MHKKVQVSRLSICSEATDPILPMLCKLKEDIYLSHGSRQVICQAIELRNISSPYNSKQNLQVNATKPFSTIPATTFAVGQLHQLSIAKQVNRLPPSVSTNTCHQRLTRFLIATAPPWTHLGQKQALQKKRFLELFAWGTFNLPGHVSSRSIHPTFWNIEIHWSLHSWLSWPGKMMALFQSLKKSLQSTHGRRYHKPTIHALLPPCCQPASAAKAVV